MRTRRNDLRHGQQTRDIVTIAKRRGGLAVPAAAIKRNEREKVVDVSGDERIERRGVETGLSSGQLTEVGAGPEPIDSVVPQATAFIREGGTVRPITVAGTR